MRGEAKVTLLQSYCISLPHNTTLFLHECFVLSVMDGKFEECVCIKFCMKLSKSTTETLKMLREAFGEHSGSLTATFE
jgi:hypothetical protein